MSVLSEKQQQVYEFIVEFVRTRGHSPKIKDISKRFGFSSPATVHKYLVALEKAGYIVRGKRNALVKLLSSPTTFAESVEVPLLGRIAAGKPIDESLNGKFVAIPKELLGCGQTYALKVVGDSMIDEHITDGDLIIVEHKETASNGETIVAIVENLGATVKKFYFDKGKVRLQPANPNYKPLLLEPEKVQVQGRVIGVIRKY
ncbi:MAG: transcriptional repressor LexA [Acidobacteriota bacterium]|nr:transcriptional repressor LexA [Blastocatellia bacterium]MDW8413316.1 transcriptional repressor LexA [Acidobacteriota bacterium]